MPICAHHLCIVDPIKEFTHSHIDQNDSQTEMPLVYKRLE